MKSERVTPDQIKSIRSMLRDGYTAKEVADSVGVHIQKVYSQKTELKKLEVADSDYQTEDDSEIHEEEEINWEEKADFWKMKYLMAHAELTELKGE